MMKTVSQGCRHWAALVWLNSLLLLCGCASTKTIYRDSGFDAAALQRGGVAVVAVTRPDVPDYYAAPYVAERVEGQLKAAWPGIQVLPMKEVKLLLGEQNQAQLEDVFRGPAALPKDKLALLQPLAGKVRYALLIDVREDDSYNEYYSAPLQEDESVYDPYTRTWTTVTIDRGYSGSWSFHRQVKALFVIYDLIMQEHVWISLGGDGASTSTYTESYRRNPSLRESAGVSPQELIEAISKRAFRKIPPAVPAKAIGAKSAAGE